MTNRPLNFDVALHPSDLQGYTLKGSAPVLQRTYKNSLARVQQDTERLLEKSLREGPGADFRVGIGEDDTEPPSSANDEEPPRSFVNGVASPEDPSFEDHDTETRRLRLPDSAKRAILLMRNAAPGRTVVTGLLASLHISTAQRRNWSQKFRRLGQKDPQTVLRALDALDTREMPSNTAYVVREIRTAFHELFDAGTITDAPSRSLTSNVAQPRPFVNDVASTPLPAEASAPVQTDPMALPAATDTKPAPKSRKRHTRA